MPRKEAEAFSEEEVIKILDGLDNADKPFRTAIYLLLDTGMRRGELCGLKWDSVNFEEGYVTVSGSLLYTPELGLFEDGTKTESAIRTIYLSEYMIPILKTYKAWQAEQRLSVGDQWQDNDRGDDFVFTRWNGKPIYPNSLSKQFKKFVQAHGLPELPLKSLRHTNATMLVVSNNVDIRTISNRLGHSQTSTTLNIYAHAVKSKNQQAAQYSPLSVTGTTGK